MRFAEPIFLWGLFSLPLLACLFWFAYRRRRKLAERFVSISMLPKVATSLSPWRRLVKTTMLLFAVAFLFIALARPQWGMKIEHVERKDNVKEFISVAMEFEQISEEKDLEQDEEIVDSTEEVIQEEPKTVEPDTKPEKNKKIKNLF